jgi:lysozyme
MFTISEKGKQSLKKYEALYLEAYQDTSGVWTIGYGNTFYEDGTKVKEGDVITENRANKLFENIVAKFSANVLKLISQRLTQNQFDSIVSLAYNIGVNAFKKSTVLKKININPADRSITDYFLVWNKSAGKVSRGLINRRKAEVANYFKAASIKPTSIPIVPILVIAVIGLFFLTK